MPSKDAHVAHAQHNHQFWAAIDPDTTPYRDWVVTGAFYEAVHWVEAYLATKGDHPTTHGQRNMAMQRYPDLAPILIDYDVLKVESENARYNCYPHTSENIRNDVTPLVTNIEACITGFI